MPWHTDGNGNVSWRGPIQNTSQSPMNQALNAESTIQDYANGGFDLYSQPPTLGGGYSGGQPNGSLYLEQLYNKFSGNPSGQSPEDDGFDTIQEVGPSGAVFTKRIPKGSVAEGGYERESYNDFFNRNKGPGFTHPSVYKAKAMAEAQDSQLRNAAHRMRRQNPGGSAQLLGMLNQRRAYQGGSSYEDAMDFWARSLKSAATMRSNGYF